MGLTRRPLPKSTAARFGGFLLAVLLAVGAVLHFQSAKHRVDSLERAFGHVRQGEMAHAEAVALLAVDRFPLDADALALLAFATGDGDVANMAVRANRRSPAANTFLFEQALAERDYPRAAAAADRIMRTASQPQAALAYAYRLERSRAGQASLFDRLDTAPPWASRWLASPGDLSPMLAVRAERLANHRPAVGCDATEAMTEALLVRDDRRRAEEVWSAHCAPGRSLPRVVQDENDRPFGWRVLRHADVQVERSGREYRFVGSASVTRPVLEQAVALTPGEAAIAFTGPGTERLRAGIVCGEASRPARPARLIVPECPNQRLVLWLIPGSGEVRLRGVLLEEN